MAGLRLDTEVTYVKGVGPARAKALNAAGVYTFDDLIRYYPRRYLDRSNVNLIRELVPGQEQTTIGKIVSTELVQTRRRKYFQIVLTDDTGFLYCKWFNGLNYIQKVFNTGDTLSVSGKVEFFNGLQIIHPDYDLLDENESIAMNTGGIISIYPSSAALKRVGLTSKGFRKLLFPLIQDLPKIYEEYLPEHILRRERLQLIGWSLHKVHFPDTLDELKKARYRLKFEELFFLQLMLLLRHRQIKKTVKPFSYPTAGKLLKQIYERLPFELTDAQKRVIKEIWNDMKSPALMNRLLQGDVGSGKTIVALMVAAIAIGNGYQVAFMAPTEILAEQHFRSIKKFCSVANIRADLLIGGTSPKKRREILPALKNGKIQLIVGTHALIQEGVEFNNLSLVIIDEQHRFGVLQRNELIEKGINPDVLVMTATPIPRTLSMTLYGDMDISLLDELPTRKARIETRLVHSYNLGEIYRFVEEQVRKGQQAYIVYPLIEESEKMDLKAAIEEYEHLKNKVFPNFSLALLHGKMSSEEKDSIMMHFLEGKTQILVSTTVIEVGIDNPNATIMIIENAERFGLTQLHQLRGRIGRGTKNSVCFLVQHKKSELANRRLQIISSTVNGFDISEEDLKLRGPGEIFGTRQSGWLKLKIASILTDAAILQKARNAVKNVLRVDPDLSSPEHSALKRHYLRHYREYTEYASIL